MKCSTGYKQSGGKCAKKSMNIFEWIVYSLVTVGGINWGIYGFSRLISKPFDLLSWMGTFGNILFTVVGIAGIISLIYIFKLMK